MRVKNKEKVKYADAKRKHLQKKKTSHIISLT